ncbi:MAG: NUDIX hydrolase [Nitrospirae bacterium]|nr:NUDIX hydrolase [Nitrospirota bacterium]
MREKPPTIRRQISSGGVIFREIDKHIEVALVSIKDRKTWCIPKGIIDKDEDPPAAALREVREESGLEGKILEKIGHISYWYFLKEEMVKVHKTVHFFLLKYVKGITGDHDDEVEESKWFPVDEAINILAYKSEKQILQKAKGMIEGLGEK